MKRNYIIPKSTEVLIHTEELIAQTIPGGSGTIDDIDGAWSRHNDDNAWDTEW